MSASSDTLDSIKNFPMGSSNKGARVAKRKADAVMSFRSIVTRNPKTKELKLPVNKINTENLTTALTGEPIFIDPRKLQKHDNKYVREGELTYKSASTGLTKVHRRFFQIFSPIGKQSIRIESSANSPRPRIKSTVAGRLELEHITNMVESNEIKPDFGFQNILTSYEKLRDTSGWIMIWDYIKSNEKFERLENYVAMRREDIKNANKLQEHKRQTSINQAATMLKFLE